MEAVFPDISHLNYVIFNVIARQWLKPERVGQSPSDWTTEVDDAGSYKFGDCRRILLLLNKTEFRVLMVPEFSVDYMKPL